MSRSSVERRLVETGTRLRRAREELAVLDEQAAHMRAEADDARVRALVSEGPEAAKEHREAEKHAIAMDRARAAALASIDELVKAQDELLERLPSDLS